MTVVCCGSGGVEQALVDDLTLAAGKPRCLVVQYMRYMPYMPLPAAVYTNPTLRPFSAHTHLFHFI